MTARKMLSLPRFNNRMIAAAATFFAVAALAVSLLVVAGNDAYAQGPGNVTNLELTRADGTVTATWVAPAGANNVKYHVAYSSDGMNSWASAADPDDNHSTASITFSADNTKTYVVGVRAFNSNGSSAWVNSSPIGPDVPDTPAAVTVARSDGTLTVTGYTVTGADIKYHITYTGNGGQSWSAADCGINCTGSSITINNVDNHATYIVGVRAGNDNGWSDWVNSAAKAPETLAGPTNVKGYRGVDANKGHIDAEWDAVTGATGYDVEYGQYGYFWKRGASNVSGTSAKLTDPDAPVGIANNVNVTTAFTWEKPANQTGAFSYEIECNSASTTDWSSATCPPDVASTSSQSLSSSVTYDISAVSIRAARIRATSGGNSSLWVKIFPTPIRANPSAQYHDGALKVWWNRPTAEVGETAYDVQCSTDGSTWIDCHTKAASLTTSFYVSPSATGTVTNIRIRARQGQRISDWASVGVPSDTAPVAPGNVAVSAATQGTTVTYTIGWDKPSGASGDLSYVVQCSSDNSTWSQCATVAATSSSSLSATTTLTTSQTAWTHVRVRADKGYLRGAWSSSASTGALTVGSVTTTTATLTIVRYSGNWYYDATSGPHTTCQGPVSGTSADLTTLTAGTAYTYTAYSASGCNSADEIASETFSTAVTVSSLGIARSGFINVGSYSNVARKAASQFTVGANTGGYTLSSVTIDIDRIYETPGDLVVAIYSNGSDDKPNTLVTTLDGSNPTGEGQYTYTCLSSCDLTAGGKYHVLLEAPDTTPGSANAYGWEKSGSNAETTEPSSNGWSIGRSFTHQNTSWSQDNSYLKYKVTAVPK